MWVWLNVQWRAVNCSPGRQSHRPQATVTSTLPMSSSETQQAKAARTGCVDPLASLLLMVHILNFCHKSYLFEGGSTCKLWSRAHESLHGADGSRQTAHAAVFSCWTRLNRAKELDRHSVYSREEDTEPTLKAMSSAHCNIVRYGAFHVLHAAVRSGLLPPETELIEGAILSRDLDKARWTCKYGDDHHAVRRVARAAAAYESTQSWTGSPHSPLGERNSSCSSKHSEELYKGGTLDWPSRCTLSMALNTIMQTMSPCWS